MTTTTLSTWASTYGVGRRHVSFSVRSSTPTTGAMNDRDAQGQWRVVRGGTIIKRQNKVLDFQWLGLNGDIVYARAIDAAGNAGDWEAYTYTVTANTAADWVRYVDTGGNDTTGDGSLGTPWATVTKAVTDAQSALTAGQVGVIFLSDDQSWAHTATVFTGSNSTACLVRFVRRGNGTNRPELTFNLNTTAFAIGKRGVFHVDGVDVTGDVASTTSQCFDLRRSGGVAADRDPFNFMVVDSTITGFANGCWADNAFSGGPGVADRGTGAFDFLAFQSTEWDSIRQYHLYGFGFNKHVLLRDTNLNPHTAAFISGTIRVWSVEYWYADGCKTDAGTGGDSVRMLVNNTNIDAAPRYITFVNHRFVHPSGATVTLGCDPGASGANYMHDVRFVDCRWEGGGSCVSVVADAGGSNGLNLSAFDMLECQGHKVSSMVSVRGSAATSHTITNVRLRNCGASGNGTNIFASLACAATRLANDCYEFVGCWMYSQGAGTTIFIDAGSAITGADLATKVGYADWNHACKSDGSTIAWMFASGDITLASWQGISGVDANSTETKNTTANLTNNGTTTAADGDFRLTADSGPLAGTGYPLPLGVSIDADGYLRSATTPDAGPYEYGATDTPEDPEIGGGSGTAIIRTGLRLGLRLGL